MSRKSSAADQEVGSQQEILLVNAGKTLLKKNSFLISTMNNAAIEVCAVDDQDVESQQLSLLNAGNTQRRWWHLVYLVHKAHQKLVSAANNTVMDTQLESTELLDNGEPEPIRELRINCGYINHEATDVVLQTENIARMVMEKDSTTLQDFGGVQGIAEALNSDMVNGIPGHEEDLLWRCTAILQPKSEAHNSSFIHFLGKSCNSSTIFLLLIFSILSFAFRIQEKGLRTGWYEGALTLVGVAEGLALAITIAITCWNKRMLGDKIFAQEPSITVTMASVTIICTDETGGLTLTPREVDRCWIGEEVISEDFKISEAFCDGIGILSLLPENSRTSADNSILSWAAEKWGLKTDI
ncbi:hypothetical protein NL676_007625 [Syzygium grande]|nr:hypothetical protein NL676_007625 [Syzygium grande]